VDRGAEKTIYGLFGDKALIQGCQWHKKGNVMGYLPKSMQASKRLSFGSSLLTGQATPASTLLFIVLPNRLKCIAEFSDDAMGCIILAEFAAISQRR
jgi:hypothetical protein